MKTSKQQLLKQERNFTNNGSDGDLLTIGFSEHLNMFTLNFNSKFEFFKTTNGLIGRTNNLIQKFNLIEN